MEHRAESFAKLADSLLDTYSDALNRSLQGKNFITDTEVKRIQDIFKLYKPRMRPALDNICEGCPAFRKSLELLRFVDYGKSLHLSLSVEEVLDFINCLLHQKDPAKNRVFLLSIADISALYCELGASGRRMVDERIHRAAAHLLTLPDRILYVGSGVFLFFFEHPDPAVATPKKQAIYDTVLSLVGESGGPGSTGAGSANPEVPVDAAFQSDFDLEQHMRHAIEAVTEAACAEPVADTGHGSGLQGLEAIVGQLRYSFAPVWDARSLFTTIYQLEVRREIEPGVFLSGNDVLTRKMHDEFCYPLQIHTLNYAFSALLDLESQRGAIGYHPALLVPFSLGQRVSIDAEKFERDIDDIFGFHSGRDLIVCLEDISEHMPSRLLMKVISALQRKEIKLFCRMPFTHEYFSAMAKIEGMTVKLDMADVLHFGFGGDVVEYIIKEFCIHARSRHVNALISHVDSSAISDIAFKNGFGYLVGKVVGDARAVIGAVTKIPVSRILMKS